MKVEHCLELVQEITIALNVIPFYVLDNFTTVLVWIAKGTGPTICGSLGLIPPDSMRIRVADHYGAELREVGKRPNERSLLYASQHQAAMHAGFTTFASFWFLDITHDTSHAGEPSLSGEHVYCPSVYTKTPSRPNLSNYR